MFIDSHCHLDYEDFSEGVGEIITRAKAAGVNQMMTISTQMAKFSKVLGVAENHPEVFCTVGTHPHHAAEPDEVNVSRETIVDCTKHAKVVGIGECGLDYFYDHAPHDVQKKVFATHIEAGVEADMPLVIHTRDAEQDTVELIRKVGGGKSKGVLHCFTGTQWLAEQGLDFGYYISFSGILTFKKSEELRAIAKMVPLDRILIETDSPYLAPMPHRGKRNEPAFVVHTAQVLAQVKNLTTKEIGKITTDNYFNLFDKAKAA